MAKKKSKATDDKDSKASGEEVEDEPVVKDSDTLDPAIFEESMLDDDGYSEYNDVDNF
ncbi:MAG: hypothetical protein WCO10_00005 [bacterium]